MPASWPRRFAEFETQKRVRHALQSLAKIPEASIRTIAGTGLVVDLQGRGPAACATEALGRTAARQDQALWTRRQSGMCRFESQG